MSKELGDSDGTGRHPGPDPPAAEKRTVLHLMALY